MKTLKKRFKSMALFGALLCMATSVVPGVAERPAAAAPNTSTEVGWLQIRGSVSMYRKIFRPLPNVRPAVVVNECDGAVDIVYQGSVPGVLHLGAHRTTCKNGNGFGGIENLRPGDTMTIYIDGTKTEYEWVREEIFDVPTDDKTVKHLTVPEVGVNVVLQTSKAPTDEHPNAVYLEWFRQVVDPPAGNDGRKISQGRPACVQVPGAGEGSWVFTNVTPVAGEGGGFITVYPAGRNDIVPNPNVMPATSTANWTSSAASPNTTLVQAGAGGEICAAAYGGAVHVIFDALAIALPGSFRAPQTRNRRLIDTRTSGGLVTNRNQCFDMPAETRDKWTVVNLTAIGRSNGWGKLQRGNGNTYSNVNFTYGDVDSNMVIIKVPSNGSLCYYSSGSSYAIVDFIATADSSTFRNYAWFPFRPIGRIAASRLVQPQKAARFSAALDDWVFLNATPIPQGGGYGTLYDCQKYPGAGSDVNYSNRIDPNVAVVKTGSKAEVCIGRTGALSAWVLDVLAVAPSKNFATPPLRRIYDSREKIR